MENKPLKYCFSKTAQLSQQAANCIYNACIFADGLRDNPTRAGDVEAELDAIRGKYGQYFPAGTEAGTVQAALSLAVQSLNGITEAGTGAAGELTPPPFCCYEFTNQRQPLNGAQTKLLNACIEFVRLNIAAACWLLRLTNRAIYEQEARAVLQQFGGVLDVYPLTPDDEQAAGVVMEPIRANIEEIRAALNIADFPELDGKQANRKLQEIGGVLWYLTGTPTGCEPNPNSWGVEGLNLDNIVL